MDTNDSASDSRTPSPASLLVRSVILSPIGGEGLVAQTVRRLGDAIGWHLRRRSTTPLRVGTGRPAGDLRDDLARSTRGDARSRLRRDPTRAQGGTYVKQLALTVPEREAQKRIATITDEYITDLTDYRVAIGGESAALAAERATPEDLDGMRELIERMDAAEAFEEFRKCDATFHVTIASCTRSQRLARAETELQAELSPLMGAFRVGPQARRTSNDQHRKIFAAIEAGDGERARRLMAEHMTSSAEAILGFTRAAASAGS